MTIHQQLNERSLLLFKSLVERYIQDGQPVGSRQLSKDSTLNLSAATIRNVMADLEDLGLIRSPHTSAGRVPTEDGYRLFIDTLLTVKPLNSQEVNRLEHSLLTRKDTSEVIETASKMLSETTRMAGVVTLPRRELVCLQHIEFVHLSGLRVLVILVTEDGEVHNKIIHTAREFSPAALQQASNYLNSIYSGRTLHSLRESVLQELRNDQQRANQEMQDAISMAQLAFDSSPLKEDYVLRGETNLMDFAELADMDKLRQLFDAFNHKREVIHLLDQCLHTDGVQIFIGKESGYHVFDHCSLVTAPYSVNNEVVGVLGVIGPTRMAYERVIPFVDITAKLLGAALNPRTSPP